MADAIIDRINPTDLVTITHLYNKIFRPVREEPWLRRRLEGRKHTLVQVARIDNDAVGFYLGFELKPDTFFTWLVGVVPEMRRAGVASQLMIAAQEWAHAERYRSMRFECDNRIRPFLHFGIANDYDITGIRWDADRMTNLIIFQKLIGDALDDTHL